MNPAPQLPPQVPRPPCVLCKHYFLTYQKSMPHGCNLFGFKSQLLPTVAVHRETGDHCNAFEKRPARQS